MHMAAGSYSTPEEPCPFRMVPLSDEEVNSLDENVVQVLEQCDCDTVSQIFLPKQLHLDDGAEDLLVWFKDTGRQALREAVPDSRCV
jgi:hypothetical protein